MVLSKVEYEFFDFEEPLSTATELARQIRLCFSDAPAVYLSWTFERQHGPDDQPYSIAYASASYCSDEPASVVDVSESSLWSRHVGRNIELRYRPATERELEYQVLEIRSSTDCTFVYSLGVDNVRVSREPPF
jgi:hypothetical protein